MPELPDIDAVWDYDDLAATETRFQEVLARPEVAADKNYTGELQTQLARTYSLRYDFPPAHAVLDEVETGLEKATPRVQVRYYLERGRTYNSAGEKEKAVPLFQEALTIAESRPDLAYFATDAAHMLAIASPPAEQVEWHRKTEQLIKASDDRRVQKWLGPLYNNLGWTLHDLGRYEEALTVFEQSVAYREEQGEPVPTRIAHWTVGRTLRSLGRYEEALARQERVLASWQEAGEEDGYVYEELGECLLALNRPEEAQPYFAQAYKHLAQDKWLQAHEPERLSRLQQLGTEN
jgi:tetratricopeptide (TPR) repeat protein